MDRVENLITNILKNKLLYMNKSSLLPSISQYVCMRDDVNIAVSVWLTDEDREQKNAYPAVLITTRYWRDLATRVGHPPAVQKIFYPVIEDYTRNGYRVVVADARGSGASYGRRLAEIDSYEVDDIGELVDWVSRQSWCNGRVATVGSSYSGNTAQCSLVSSPDALKVFGNGQN